MSEVDQKQHVDHEEISDIKGENHGSSAPVGKHMELYIEALDKYGQDGSLDPATERRLKRKLDRRILPLLGICYCFYYIDKT